MQSRISIELDFSTGQPYISVISRLSDDMRDKALKFWAERLGYTSSWAKIHFHSQQNEAGELRFFITPITPDQIKAEAEIITEQARLAEQPPGNTN